MNHSSSLGTSDTGSINVRLRLRFSGSMITPPPIENGEWDEPVACWEWIIFEDDIMLVKELWSTDDEGFYIVIK